MQSVETHQDPIAAIPKRKVREDLAANCIMRKGTEPFENAKSRKSTRCVQSDINGHKV